MNDSGRKSLVISSSLKNTAIPPPSLINPNALSTSLDATDFAFFNTKRESASFNPQSHSVSPIHNRQQQQQKVSIPLSRRPDCMYFVKGNCTKGDNCIFRHNLLAKNGTQEICQNWVRYHSCDDQLCKKLHPKQTLKASLEEIEEMEKHAKVQKQQKKPTVNISVPSQPIITTPLSLTEAKRPDCMFYVRGSCSKGDKCLFRHNDLAKNGTLEVCSKWQLEGKCDDPNCINLHLRPISHSSNSVPTNSTPYSKRPDYIYMNGSSSKKEASLFRYNENTNGSMTICSNWIQFGHCNDPDCLLFHPKNISSPGSLVNITELKSDDSSLLETASDSETEDNPIVFSDEHLYEIQEGLDHILEITSSGNEIDDTLLNTLLNKFIKSKTVKFHTISNYKVCAIFANSDFAEKAFSLKDSYDNITIKRFSEASQESQQSLYLNEYTVIPPGPKISVTSVETDGATISMNAPELTIIRYTLDGSIPNVNSEIYSDTITVPFHTKILAKCFKNFLPESEISEFIVSDVLNKSKSSYEKFSMNSNRDFKLPFGSIVDCVNTETKEKLFALNISENYIQSSEKFSSNISSLLYLNSEYIAPISYFTQIPYSIMIPNVNAISLYDYVIMNKGTPIDLNKRIKCLSSIANGLNYLHANNISHGCLSLASTLLYENSVVKLAFFGLTSVDMPITFKNIHYLSPQRLSDNLHSFSDDIYAFGTIAYLLCISSVSFVNPLDNNKGQLEINDRDIFHNSDLSPFESLTTRSPLLQDDFKPSSSVHSSFSIPPLLPFSEMNNNTSKHGLNFSFCGNNIVSPFDSNSVNTFNSLSPHSETFNFQKSYNEDDLSMLVNFFKKGNRLRIPLLCEYGYGKIIRSCWKQLPEKRPSLTKLLKLLDQF